MFEKLRALFQSEEPLSPEHQQRVDKLQQITEVPVENPHIYIRALRHRSTLADDNYSPTDSYERLEFLGDAVLDLIVTEIIFDLFPKEEEGFLQNCEPN
jgi:ribonuclease-3